MHGYLFDSAFNLFREPMSFHSSPRTLSNCLENREMDFIFTKAKTTTAYYLRGGQKGPVARVLRAETQVVFLDSKIAIFPGI